MRAAKKLKKNFKRYIYLRSHETYKELLEIHLYQVLGN